MSRKAMLSLAVAGIFIFGIAAVAQANWYHMQEKPEGAKSGMMAPSDEPGTKAPEVGSYQYQEALETGTLPPSEDSRFSGGPETSGGEEIPTVEADGSTYRLGVDSGP